MKDHWCSVNKWKLPGKKSMLRHLLEILFVCQSLGFMSHFKWLPLMWEGGFIWYAGFGPKADDKMMMVSVCVRVEFVNESKCIDCMKSVCLCKMSVLLVQHNSSLWVSNMILIMYVSFDRYHNWLLFLLRLLWSTSSLSTSRKSSRTSLSPTTEISLTGERWREEM